MRIMVLGLGAVGARAARQLVEAEEVRRVVLAGGSAQGRRAFAGASGRKALALEDASQDDARADAVVLCGPAGTHLGPAREHLAAGRPVISVSDDLKEVRALLELGAEATERGVPVVVGAGFSPGLSCLLARHAARDLDTVEEVHISRYGTGGPACAAQRRRALTRRSLEWRDHGWQRQAAGSGRELCWFPDPVGARDCYRGELPDPLLLAPAFPCVARVTARLAATRRERLCPWLAPLRRPQREGMLGSVRVEVRGWRRERSEVVVLGALDRPAMAAGVVASLAARAAARGELPAGAGGLASMGDPLPWLAELARLGVKTAVFEGAQGA